MTLEIIADGVLFQPWNSKFSIVPSEKPNVKLSELIEPQQDVVDLTDFLKEIKQNVATIIDSQEHMEHDFYEQLETNEKKASEQIQVLDENIRTVTKQVQTTVTDSLKTITHRVQTIYEALDSSQNTHDTNNVNTEKQLKTLRTNVGIIGNQLTSLAEAIDSAPDNSYQINRLSSELNEGLDILKNNVVGLSETQNQVHDKQNQFEGDLHSQLSKIHRVINVIDQQVNFLKEAQQFDAQKYFRTNELPKVEQPTESPKKNMEYKNILENWIPFDNEQANGKGEKQTQRIQEEKEEVKESLEDTVEYTGIIDRWNAFADLNADREDK
jgi:hypothetical protein